MDRDRQQAADAAGLVTGVSSATDFESVPLLEVESPFFTAAGRGEALEQLLHFLRFSETTLLITGPEGSGRTTLRHQLLLQMPDWFVFQLEGSRADAGPALTAFIEQMDSCPDQPRLLLIDDAHLLDDSLLEAALAALAGCRDWHLLLLGSEGLTARVKRLMEEGALLHRIELQPLNAVEIEEYVGLKLSVSARHPDASLPADELTQLIENSAGLPAELDRFLRARTAASLAEAPAEEVVASPGLPVIHMLLLVVLITGLVMAFFYRAIWLTETPDLPAPAPSAKIERSQVDLSEPEFQGTQGVTAELASMPRAEEVAIASEPEATASPGALVAGGEKEALLSEPTSGETVREGVPLVQNVQTSREPEADDMAVARDLVTDREPVAVDSQLTSTNLVRKPEDDPLSALILSELTHAEAYLLSLPEDAYVLQVLSAVSKPAVEEFVSRQENCAELYIYTARRSGADWHIVVTKGYDSLPEARAQLRLLPEAQKKLGPWPRPATAIQHSIREYRDI